MKKLALVLMFCTSVYAADSPDPLVEVEGNHNNSNVNVCKPNITVKTGSCSSCCKPKVIEKKVIETKTVEVIKTETKLFKNKIHALVGYGAKGNLVEEAAPGGTSVHTDNGMVFGLQYVRTVKEYDNSALDLLLQAQTNRTFSAGIGLEF